MCLTCWERAETMKKLTELEALLAMKEMWEWLAENPTAYKEDYFDFTEVREEDRPRLGCFACEYAKQMDKRPGKTNCTFCPVWKSAEDGDRWSPCTHPELGGEYAIWIDKTGDERAKAALAIATLAKQRIEELCDE